MLQAVSEFSAAVKKSSTEVPANDLDRAARMDRYSSAIQSNFKFSVCNAIQLIFGSLTTFLLNFHSLFCR